MSQETDLRNELHKFILLHYSRIWFISILRQLLFLSIFWFDKYANFQYEIMGIPTSTSCLT